MVAALAGKHIYLGLMMKWRKQTPYGKEKDFVFPTAVVHRMLEPVPQSHNCASTK
jgi:hypothetical protein